LLKDVEFNSSNEYIKLFPLVLAVILTVTAVPFGFRSAALHLIYTKWNWTDIGLNVLLYFPLGLVAGRGLTGTALLGLGISTFAETVQLWSPGRFPSPLDITANLLGSILGCLAARRLQRRGWNPSVLRFPDRAGWLFLALGGVGVAALLPSPLPNDFSNWDPAFQVAFGAELNGNRRWRGEVLEAAIVPATVDASLISRLAREGPGSIRRHSPDLPQAPAFQLGAPVQTYDRALILPTSSTREIFRQLTQRNRLSVLLWIRTADRRQYGPARIITYSRDPWQRNLTIGQQHQQIIFRLRTPATGPNGMDPEAETAPVLESSRDTLITATYDGRYSRIYVDDRLSAEVDLAALRMLAGLPALTIALLAGALLFLGPSLLWRSRMPRWLIAAVVFLIGLTSTLTLPRAGYPGLSLRLALVFLGGAVAAHLALRAVPNGRNPAEG